MVFILLYVSFALSLFIFPDVRYIAAAALAVALSLLFMPFKEVKKGLVPISLFLLFTFLGNLFFHPGRILYGSGLFIVTDEGAVLAAVRSLRVFILIYAVKVLTAFVPPEEMVVAMNRLLRPVEKTGVPVNEFFTITGLTVKAFPVLIRHLAAAYAASRENTGGSGFRERLSHLVSFMVPVFSESIRSPERFFEAGREHGPGC